MLKGKVITLRLVKDTDVDLLWEKHVDIINRGPYFPLDVMAQPKFRREFNETGFWETNKGMLVIVDKDDKIIGNIAFFPTVYHLDELELSYQIYDTEHRGKGVATEAVSLMTRYLFESLKHNRIRLIIHPDNAASRRVAEKAGYQFEGIARGAWYRGKHHDVRVYAAIKDEFLADS